MNLDPTSDAESSPGESDRRLLYVLNDFHFIPAAESKSMLDGHRQWLSTLISYKLLRKRTQPAFAIEIGRWIRGDSRQVSKRILKRFEELRAKMSRLGFAPAFFATIPAIGPHSAAVMGMSRRDGSIHLLAHGSTSQSAEGVADTGHFEFLSWLTDEPTVVTCSQVCLPKPRAGIDQWITTSHDPEKVLKKHRERLRRRPFQAVASQDLFEKVSEENQAAVKDLANRNVIRLASSAEVARIRSR